VSRSDNTIGKQTWISYNRFVLSGKHSEATKQVLCEKVSSVKKLKVKLYWIAFMQSMLSGVKGQQSNRQTQKTAKVKVKTLDKVSSHTKRDIITIK